MFGPYTDKISKLEGGLVTFFQAEEWKEKKMKKDEQCLRDLWDTIRPTAFT